MTTNVKPAGVGFTAAVMVRERGSSYEVFIQFGEKRIHLGRVAIRGGRYQWDAWTAINQATVGDEETLEAAVAAIVQAGQQKGVTRP